MLYLERRIFAEYEHLEWIGKSFLEKEPQRFE